MVKKQEIKVVKIPISGAILSKPQTFPRMPRLYLELVENKQKIKQDMINTEYVPPYSGPNIDEQSQTSSKEKFENRLDKLLDDDKSSIDEKNKYSPSVDKDDVSSISELSINENIKTDNVKTNDDDNLSLRLKELLNDNDSESDVSIETPKKSDNKYSKHRDISGHSVKRNITKGEAPTLSELERGGGYIPKQELRDINQTNQVDEQKQEDLKREILFKFELLRKSYPLANIPEYNIHTDLTLLEKSYADSVRRLSLDSSVESYKTYLVYGFMGCEFVFGNFLGFDMQGFTQQQIISMSSYEKLLIELGEKSYIPDGSKWPVELRLLFMIIMNAAFFVISKMMMKKTGANLMGMINTMNKSTPPVNQKRKMKGPSIDLDEIP